jgi:nicotinamide-nucleotide amidase
MADALDPCALAAQLGQALNTSGGVLATAESCTGGWVAEVLTSVPGSSVWFERGFVTYSNAAKREMLGVRPETLRAFGAVSEATAGEMVQGALDHSHATLAVAITGIAGPGGGTAEKPVGMVCFAWADKQSPPRCATYYFEGDRQAVRRQAVNTALQGLLPYATQPRADGSRRD